MALLKSSFLFVITIILTTMLLVKDSFSQERTSRAIWDGIWRGAEVKYVDGAVCLKIREGADRQAVSALLRSLRGELLQDFDRLRWGLVSFPEGTNVFAAIDGLLQSPLLENAEPEMVGHIFFDPNDPYYAGTSPATYEYQWYLYNHGQHPPGGTSGADINIRRAWDVTRGSSSVKIAVLDSGIPLDSVTYQLSHPDLKNKTRIKLGSDFIFSDPLGDNNPTVRDTVGHGTHVTGILAAETDNNTGIAGIAGNCSVRIIQVVNNQRLTSWTAFKNGVYEAVDQGAKIINFSAGFNSSSSLGDTAVVYARDHGVLLVAAAGGRLDPCEPIVWPARYSTTYNNVIAVGATDKNDVQAPYSPCGPALSVVAPGGAYNPPDTIPVPDHYSQVDTGATWSTVPNYTNLSGETSYSYNAGTSMATPMVSGIAALILSINASLTPSQVRDIIQTTTDDKGLAGFDTVYGWGRVNAFRAVSKANGTPSAPSNLQMGTKKINSTTYCPKLTWTANAETDLMVYRIYRRFSGDPPSFTKIDSVSYQTTTYIDYSVQTGTYDYAYYKITAVDAAPLESGFSNEVNIQTNQTSKTMGKNEEENLQQLPKKSSISSNYPNPFNPLTLIRYQVPEDIQVSIKLYDVLGRETRLLVDEFKEAGYYEVTLDASSLSSGVYFYRMIAGNFAETRKLVVTK